ncbi:MAG: hypothetical protein ACFCUX_03850 [Candidatus Methylacidiphilales bacterium]
MSLESTILECIRTDLDEETFNQAALELMRYQAKKNLVYRSFIHSSGLDPVDIFHWTQIPALPATAFREGRVASFPPVAIAHTFYTSGTTDETTGRHEFQTMEHYEKSLLTGFVNALPDVSHHHWVSLIPSFEDRSHASLSYMITFLASHLARHEVDFLCDEHFDFKPELIFEHLLEVSCGTSPIFLLGTSFAFARLFESMMECRVQAALPPNTVVFDTGGYKGHSKEYSRQEFKDLMQETLAIRPHQIWNEYGMTELSSQAYAQLDEELHRFPAWTRCVVRNPLTREICGPGEQGIVEVIDLANVGSVLAVSTSDAGIPHRRGLELVGRMPTESLRGCSLSYE